MLINAEDLQVFTPGFPHVAKRINDLWGTAELRTYIKGLLGHSRSGKISRLPKEIESSLSKLLLVHERDFEKIASRRPSEAALKSLKANSHFQIVYEGAPHIARKLLMTWGLPQCDRYLQSVFSDTRDGRRKGFPKKVGDALLQIMYLHEARYAKKRPG